LKLLLVFNPHAALGRAAALMPDVLSALESFAKVEVFCTRGRGDATRFLAGATLDDFDGVIAAGGDGTLFEVLNGLYCNDAGNKPPLGLLPVGTGNAFSRDLGLQPGDWRKGIEIIRAGRKHAVDVGRVQQADGDFHFLNIIGAGLPVDAMQTADRMKVFGRSAYTISTLWHALRLHSYPLRFTVDGVVHEQESMFIEIANSRYTGTSFLIAPDAQMDDGLFDIILVRRMPRIRLLRLFPSIYSGEHVNYPEVTLLQGSEITIEFPGGMTLAPDGELHGGTPATVKCLHRDLEIFGG
jgi:diacylglycerol kinase (ATP)